MRLTGKHIIIELSATATEQIFRIDSVDSAAFNWVAVGEVRGETLGVGLWVDFYFLSTTEDVISSEEPRTREFARGRTRLVRWSAIDAAVVVETRPDPRHLGFRHRNPGEPSR